MKLIKKILRTIKNDRLLLAGCIGICILLFIVVAAPLITEYDAKLFGPDALVAPGDPAHPLGTNHLGQDIWSMLIYGTRTSLMVAVVASFISALLGIIIGGIAGFFGGWADRIISELINVFLMIPTLFLVLLIVAMFGSSILNIMIVIGLTSWPSNAKLMRAQALSLRERTFVKSAQAMGENRRQILMKYIIPNGVFPVVANTTVGMANAILLEASLSFLGLGDPTVISWGQMVYDGKQYLTSAWWIAAFGGVAICLTLLIFYMTGDGLNHVLNPKHGKAGE